MYLDNENNILIDIREQLVNNNTLLFPCNSFTRKVYKWLQNSDQFIANNMHSALPPDYFSDFYNSMFDITRINDSEIRKNYNPVKIREKSLEREIKTNFPDLPSTVELIINSHDDDNYDHDHNYTNYLKNEKRVIQNHINKIDIWKKEHPRIKHKGLIIFDETELYIHKIYSNQENKFHLHPGEKGNPIYHEPWNDKNMIDFIYKSDLDFVVWFCPYKKYGALCNYPYYKVYPSIIILDTRYPRENYTEYPKPLTSL